MFVRRDAVNAKQIYHSQLDDARYRRKWSLSSYSQYDLYTLVMLEANCTWGRSFTLLSSTSFPRVCQSCCKPLMKCFLAPRLG